LNEFRTYRQVMFPSRRRNTRKFGALFAQPKDMHNGTVSFSLWSYADEFESVVQKRRNLLIPELGVVFIVLGVSERLD